MAQKPPRLLCSGPPLGVPTVCHCEEHQRFLGDGGLWALECPLRGAVHARGGGAWKEQSAAWPGSQGHSTSCLTHQFAPGALRNNLLPPWCSDPWEESKGL